MRNWAQMLFWLVLIAVVGLAIWAHFQLPARVATHFDLQGRPNGWMSRGAHTALQLVMLVGLGALFQGLVWLNHRLPDEFINVPYRDYWLAGERRAASLAWLQQMFLLVGSGVLLSLGTLFWQVWQANLGGEPRLVGGIAMIVVTGTGVAVLVLALLWRFHRPPATG